MDGIDLFQIEEEARQPQLIPGFAESIDHLDQLFEGRLGQALEFMDNTLQSIPQGIDPRVCEFVQAGCLKGLMDLPDELTISVLKNPPVRLG